MSSTTVRTNWLLRRYRRWRGRPEIKLLDLVEWSNRWLLVDQLARHNQSAASYPWCNTTVTFAYRQGHLLCASVIVPGGTWWPQIQIDFQCSNLSTVDVIPAWESACRSAIGRAVRDWKGRG